MPVVRTISHHVRTTPAGTAAIMATAATRCHHDHSLPHRTSSLTPSIALPQLRPQLQGHAALSPAHAQCPTFPLPHPPPPRRRHHPLPHSITPPAPPTTIPLPASLSLAPRHLLPSPTSCPALTRPSPTPPSSHQPPPTPHGHHQSSRGMDMHVRTACLQRPDGGRQRGAKVGVRAARRRHGECVLWAPPSRSHNCAPGPGLPPPLPPPCNTTGVRSGGGR